MSDRNRDDYFDLDNFDDSVDSRDYRRRQPNRRQTNYGGRPSYNTRRPVKRRRNRTRTRNRVMIVTAGLLAVVLVFTLLILMFRGCGGKKTPVGVSTEPKNKQETTVDPSVDPSNPQGATNPNDKLSPANFIAPNPTDDNSEGYDAGAIYVWNKTGFELFGGSEYTAKTYAETINGFADKLAGMNVYSMMIPNHTEIGLPERLKATANTNSQAENIKTAYAAMKDNVTPVNAYNYLSEHCNEYIYFKSDHHWTGLGAYYAYAAFCDTLGMTPLKLEDCTKQTIPDFTGTFFNLANGLDTDTVEYYQFPYSVTMDITDANGNVNNYDSPYFEAEGSGTLSYGVFIYGDNPLTVLHSSSQNAASGKKIAVVKESYGNAFVSYLTNNYEEVHIMDLRTFRDVSTADLTTYCRQNGITDVLFLNGIMSANTQIQLDSMTALFD